MLQTLENNSKYRFAKEDDFRNIETTLKDRIQSHILEMFRDWDTNDEEKKKNMGLISGTSGKILCGFYVGRFTASNEITKKAESLLDFCIENLNNQTFQLSNMFSFCNGLAGVCYLLEHLVDQGFVEKEYAEGLEEIETFLYEMGLKSLRVEKSDFLHGGMGVLYYFLKRIRFPHNRERVSKMITAYLENAKIDDKGLRMRNTVLLERKPEEYDLGLAHGLAGHLIIIAEAYQKGIEKETCKHIIEQGLRYFEQSFKDSKTTGYRGMYPVSIIEDIPADDPENLAFYDSRLAWCYGDLNYAIMFLKLYEVFGKKELLEKANYIGLEAAKRITPEKSKIKNAFFCHGSAGVSNMFFQLYKKTGDVRYKEASNTLLIDTLSVLDEQLEVILNTSKNCLLNGRAGVILTLLSRHDQKASAWNDLFLLH